MNNIHRNEVLKGSQCDELKWDSELLIDLIEVDTLYC